MNNIKVNKRALQIGTAVIWAAVLLGVSFFTEAEQSRTLDWELLEVIVGGFIIQNLLINLYIKNGEKEVSHNEEI